jgi:hypothetical protein
MPTIKAAMHPARKTPQGVGDVADRKPLFCNGFCEYRVFEKPRARQKPPAMF